MIERLTISNLAIVDSAEIEFGEGLTCLVGETGAGKTLVAGAIGLLFGADAAKTLVGPAGDHAFVEGQFRVPAEFFADPACSAFAELRPDDAEGELVIARRIAADGRSRALAWGRTVSRADLQAAGARLLAVAGQHAQRRLVEGAYQRGLLDAAGDDEHHQLVARMGEAHARWSAARDHHAALVLEAAELERRRDEIIEALERIDQVAPTVEDERELRAARARARHHAELVEGLAAASAALTADGAAIDLVGSAWARAQQLAELDPALGDLADRVGSLQGELSDVAAQLRGRLDDMGSEPMSIDEIEERLGEYAELQRRFGGTTEAVCGARETLVRQRELLEDGASAVAQAAAELDAAHADAVTSAAALSASRSQIAERLTSAIEHELDSLAMTGARVVIELAGGELRAHGSDDVSFLIAANPGVSPQPIATAASGGELSRIALALQVATGRAEAPTSFFDEIDAGIGGETAHAVAAKLVSLATTTQVLCITHLPQVAARADALVRIDKSSGRTQLRPLQDEVEIVDELCRMAGGRPDDETARAHAANLRSRRFTRGTRTPASALF